MFVNTTSMNHNSCAASAHAEAAASFCAVLLLGSAILAESIFVLISLVIVVVLICFLNNLSAAV